MSSPDLNNPDADSRSLGDPDAADAAGQEEQLDKPDGDNAEPNESKDSEDEDDKKNPADPDAEPPAPIDVDGETKRVIGH